MASSMFDLNDFHDDNVWDVICDGKTKGIFQLESQLGRSWAKRVRPRNIIELAALISLIRPGCLKAYTDGKSLTQHYVDRKAGLDPVSYPHGSLESILSETYGVLVYQEQSMMIAQELAGFNLKEADTLRKAIGKKKAGLMEEVKTSFLSGATSKGVVTKEAAEEVFSWIEKSNRYAFNKSHAVSYAVNAYWSAYCKYHKPFAFYVTYLNHSHRKPDQQREIKELVMDAKMCDIDVYPPRLEFLSTDFTKRGDKIIFGLSHLKHVGDKECIKIANIIDNVDTSTYSWPDVLINIIHHGKLNKQAVIALISVGAFTGANNKIHRQQMLYEFDSWKQLTAREQAYICKTYANIKFSSLSACISDMIDNFKLNSKRLNIMLDIKNSLDRPFYELTDTIVSIAEQEQRYMGCSLTCSKIDSIDDNFSNYMCKDISLGTIKGKVNLAVQINSIREYKTKRGKNPGQTMAFLSVEDNSGSLDSVTIFPECYEKYREFLIEGNTVMVAGETSKKENSAIIINKVYQA